MHRRPFEGRHLFRYHIMKFKLTYKIIFETIFVLLCLIYFSCQKKKNLAGLQQRISNGDGSCSVRKGKKRSFSEFDTGAPSRKIISYAGKVRDLCLCECLKPVMALPYILTEGQGKDVSEKNICMYACVLVYVYILFN